MKSIFRTPVFFYPALLLGLLSLLAACQSDGEVGPKGQNGANGPAGDKGPTGSLYYKTGFIRGTITGTGKDGVTPINETFNYEFSGSQLPLIFTQSTEGNFCYPWRTDSTNTSSISMGFTASADFTTAKVRNLYLNFYKKTGATQYKELGGQLSVYSAGVESPATITRLAYNPATGLLTGDFTWRVEPTTGSSQYYSRSSTGRPFTVTGAFSFTARKGSY
jgi:hypothetical protein